MLNHLSLILTSVFILSGCNYIFSPNVDWGERERLSRSETKNFELFYRGNPNPPIITEDDYKGYVSALNDPEYANLKAKLISYFGTNYTLWAYYFLDMDGDEIQDWQWNDEDKKFIAIDQDIDGDGVENIEDADPFDFKITGNDFDRDGIVDHLDWDKNNDGTSDVSNVTNKMAYQQKILYRNFKIVAINQDAFHNERTLKTFREVLRLGYKNVFDTNDGVFPGLRYLGAQRGEEDGKTLAWFRRITKMITILDLGRKEGKNELFPGITPLPFYGTVIHELAHAFQYYIESKEGRDLLFEDYLSDYWQKEGEDFLYKEKSKTAWKELIDGELDQAISKYKETKNKKEVEYFYDFSRKKVSIGNTKIAKENNIISRYSLTSPKEYFAEAVPAYAFKIVIIKRFSHLAPKDQEKVTKRIERKTQFKLGLGVNNVPSSLEKFIEKELGIEEGLRFDREFKRPDGLRGRWIRR